MVMIRVTSPLVGEVASKRRVRGVVNTNANRHYVLWISISLLTNRESY